MFSSSCVLFEDIVAAWVIEWGAICIWCRMICHQACQVGTYKSESCMYFVSRGQPHMKNILCVYSRWWFSNIFYFHPWRKWSNLTSAIFFNTYTDCKIGTCQVLGVSKNRGKTSKMDGENHGKPSCEKMGDLGGVFPHHFRKTPVYPPEV